MNRVPAVLSGLVLAASLSACSMQVTSTASSSSTPSTPKTLTHCTVNHLDIIYERNWTPEPQVSTPTCGSHRATMDAYGKMLEGHTYTLVMDQDDTIVDVRAQ